MVKELIAAGQYRAVIDRTYPLEDVVEATRYAESGQKTGNVVLTIEPQTLITISSSGIGEPQQGS